MLLILYSNEKLFKSSLFSISAGNHNPDINKWFLFDCCFSEGGVCLFVVDFFFFSFF